VVRVILIIVGVVLVVMARVRRRGVSAYPLKYHLK